jgi:hypothetical protein
MMRAKRHVYIRRSRPKPHGTIVNHKGILAADRLAERHVESCCLGGRQIMIYPVDSRALG